MDDFGWDLCSAGRNEQCGMEHLAEKWFVGGVRWSDGRSHTRRLVTAAGPGALASNRPTGRFITFAATGD